ncbi:mitochondrial ribosomal protein S33 [Megalopta genalis]|uniref:mitochondrial ribosomal protein S33 n=1 Tax=Megalopta genalis TaxID=115081 RepID=UPI0014436914|nr:28S ribosomal protein S33, mitochondrial [Megalopta genalis]XP_033331599.1 28S ribosomal protein S33, mitochondrial [Megalopta genalis]
MANKYVDLTKVGTVYAKNMNRLSNKIFGEATRETNRRSMKVVKLFSELPTYKNPEIVRYYPQHNEISTLMKQLRLYGLYRDEHADFKDEYQRLRELRGKQKWVPPIKRK